MSTLDKYFSEQIDKYIAQMSDHTLIFFKGFSIAQVRQLIEHKNSVLNDPDLLDGDFINLEYLSESWLDIAAKIKRAKKPLVGFYEELVAIREVIPRIKLDHLVVVENNLLSPWVPCYYPYDKAVDLFDHLEGEHEAPVDSELSQFLQLYGDVKLLDDKRALLLPTTVDDERLVTIQFWKGLVGEQELPEEAIEHIEVGSKQDWEYCLDITNGAYRPALILQNGEEPLPHVNAVILASMRLGFEAYYDELELYKEKVHYNDCQFTQILKKYWGNNANFRPLLFYKDPDRSQATETITQGQIIAEIVDQCESAKDGEPYSNIFITAPTGSGKSILFQIPALYLAEKYNLVTIVVSPLIALMNDQVDQLEREKGITIAACINSSMSMEERSNVIEQIHAGKKSLLYLAPELLLTTHLESFLGGRQVGMVVIDEAHTVTSWGRDFRSDYWFLGDFLKKTARDGFVFPVLCLTATAVYSGEDDVVNDTIHELELGKTIIHLGNVKRKNITFDIAKHDPASAGKRIEDAKMDMTLNRMRQYIGKGEKVLTYFPYRSQVDQIYTKINAAEHIKIRRYHGQIPSVERKMVERDYKSGMAMGLFCTKAFGMGIDVGDIKHVIHFAPTGTLSDYVQEIGRAARNVDIQGIAHIDYYPSDLRYVRSLNGISEMRQYQLREMLKKICAIQKAKKRRNLLISSETFEYLFKENEVENRTKSGLMLLAKDLSNKYTFPVLIVRPKAMLSKNYINVPTEIEDQFMRKYGEYCKFQQGRASRVVPTEYQSKASDITVYSVGKTYLVDMAAIWENCYPDRAFGMFKKEFFEKEYRVGNKTYTVAPRVRVEIRYSKEAAEVSQRVSDVMTAIMEIFDKYRNGETKQFTLRDFETELAEKMGEKVVPHDKIGLLLDIFTESVNENAVYSQTRNRVRVLRGRKMAGADETVYFVSNFAYAQLPSFFTHQLSQCAVNADDNSFFRFYPLITNKQIEIMPLLRLLELLGLANYEIRGGEKAEVFIRINDPEKLQRLAMTGRYTNGVLQNIKERHRNNEKLLSAFFAADMSDDDRWELIEQYFLGNEEYVREHLGIGE